MSHTPENHDEADNAEIEAKIAEIEDAILELTDLCENHDELMAVLRTAIAGKRRENAIFAALSAIDEDAVVAMASEVLEQDLEQDKEKL